MQGVVKVKSLQEPEYTLVTDSQEVDAIAHDFGVEEDYGSYIVKVVDGEYREVWGVHSSVPRLDDTAFPVAFSGDDVEFDEPHEKETGIDMLNGRTYESVFRETVDGPYQFTRYEYDREGGEDSNYDESDIGKWYLLINGAGHFFDSKDEAIAMRRYLNNERTYESVFSPNQDKFRRIYIDLLISAAREDPEEYGFSSIEKRGYKHIEEIPIEAEKTVDRMIASLKNGGATMGTVLPKVARKLKIPPTLKAIRSYLLEDRRKIRYNRLFETPIDISSPVAPSTVVRFLYNAQQPNQGKPFYVSTKAQPAGVTAQTKIDNEMLDALVKKLSAQGETLKPSNALKAWIGKSIGEVMKDNKVELKSLNGLLTTVEDTGASVK